MSIYALNCLAQADPPPATAPDPDPPGASDGQPTGGLTVAQEALILFRLLIDRTGAIVPVEGGWAYSLRLSNAEHESVCSLAIATEPDMCPACGEPLAA